MQQNLWPARPHPATPLARCDDGLAGAGRAAAGQDAPARRCVAVRAGSRDGRAALAQRQPFPPCSAPAAAGLDSAALGIMGPIGV